MIRKIYHFLFSRPKERLMTVEECIKVLFKMDIENTEDHQKFVNRLLKIEERLEKLGGINER